MVEQNNTLKEENGEIKTRSLESHKTKRHLCKGCFTEWVLKENHCYTCKKMEKRRLEKLSKVLKEVIGMLK